MLRNNGFGATWLFMVICCASILVTAAYAADSGVGDGVRRAAPGSKVDVDQEQWPKLFNQVKKSLLRYAVEDGGAPLDLSNITSVQSQVVSGKKYYINANIKHPNGREAPCTITIWEQLWRDFEEVTIECPDQDYKITKGGRAKRQLVGGWQPVAPEDYKDIEDEIVESLIQLGEKPDGRKLNFVRIKGAQRQPVAGVKYFVQAEVIDEDEEGIVCEFEIWLKAWMNFRRTSVRCNEEMAHVVVKGEERRRKRRSMRMMPLLGEDEFDVESDMATVNLFQKYKIDYNRSYANEEEHAMRYRVFKQNLFLIEQLNKFEAGTGEYGVTEFADLTTQEYFQRTGLRERAGTGNRIPNSVAEIPDIEVPTSFDWREKNAVTPVKNQGNCGSCWAFSVTGNVEGIHAAKTGTLESYSEQELLDCDTVDGACNGGLPDDAYKAIEHIGGLELETEYPYKAHKEKCLYNPSLHHVSVSGAVDLPKDEASIAKYLVENGPVSIGINANAMQFYHRGVSHPWKALCRPETLDHGVLLVGFGEAPGKKGKPLPYWIVKNSWGPTWGEKGYYRVFRGDNTCGVGSMASSAVLG